MCVCVCECANVRVSEQHSKPYALDSSVTVWIELPSWPFVHVFDLSVSGSCSHSLTLCLMCCNTAPCVDKIRACVSVLLS